MSILIKTISVGAVCCLMALLISGAVQESDVTAPESESSKVQETSDAIVSKEELWEDKELLAELHKLAGKVDQVDAKLEGVPKDKRATTTLMGITVEKLLKLKDNSDLKCDPAQLLAENYLHKFNDVRNWNFGMEDWCKFYMAARFAICVPKFFDEVDKQADKIPKEVQKFVQEFFSHTHGEWTDGVVIRGAVKTFIGEDDEKANRLEASCKTVIDVLKPVEDKYQWEYYAVILEHPTFERLLTGWHKINYVCDAYVREYTPAAMARKAAEAAESGETQSWLSWIPKYLCIPE